MRFSMWPSVTQPWDDVLEIATYCGAAGWDGVYVADHFMPNGPDETPLDGPTFDCWSMLAALAASVPRVRLSPLVTSVTYRHPAVLAKIAAAVDHISHGRLTLGIGAGWQLNEHYAYGIPLGTIAERMDRFEEATQVLHSLLRERRTTFAGKYFELHDAPNQPIPVQERLPLLIGGGGERRTLRIVAQYADEWNYWTTPDLLAQKLAILHQHCEAVGRDPSEIHVSTQALLYLSNDQAWLDAKRASEAGSAQPVIIGSPSEVVDIIGQYRDAGADEIIVPDFSLGNLARKKETYDLFMQEVVPAFR